MKINLLLSFKLIKENNLLSSLNKHFSCSSIMSGLGNSAVANLIFCAALNIAAHKLFIFVRTTSRLESWKALKEDTCIQNNDCAVIFHRLLDVLSFCLRLNIVELFVGFVLPPY